MLKQMSRLKHTRRIIILGFVLLMAVSLIVFYGPGRNSSTMEPSKNTTVVAKVAGEDITVADIAGQKESMQARYGGISLAQLGLNDKRILDGLIQKKIIEQEAIRLGLFPSEADIGFEIRKQFRDPSTGQYINLDPDKDPARYKQIAVSNAGSVEAFEQQFRDQLVQRNLRAFVTAAVKVSDEEVQDDYKRRSSTFDVTYVIISADKLAEKIQPSDEELKSYYEAHKDEFKITEPQKKIRYVYVDQAKSGDKAQIADKDLRDAYTKLSPEAKQAGVKVQQILLKVARKDLDSQVEAKAKELITKARAASPEKGEEVFSDLARGNSEDPQTAKNGGYLARPVKKNPNKVDALYDRAVDMQPGDVSDIPIRFGGNWYILRRGESVPKTFEEAKPELLASARNSKGYSAAAKIAERAKNRLKETKDAQKVAQELAAEANMSPAEMVKETPYIKPGDDVPGIGSSQQFEGVIAPLNNPNDVGDQTGVKGGFAIPMLVEKKEPRTPDFEEIKTKVAGVVKQQRAQEQLEQKAKELAAASNDVAGLKAAAGKAGLEVATEEGYKLGSALGKTATTPALDDAVYRMKTGEVTKSPLKVGDTFVVLGLADRKEADLADFAKQRDQLTQTMLSARQNQIYEDYLGAVERRMKQDGKIKVYQDVLAALEESEPDIAAPPQRQFPMPAR